MHLFFHRWNVFLNLTLNILFIYVISYIFTRHIIHHLLIIISTFEYIWHISPFFHLWYILNPTLIIHFIIWFILLFMINPLIYIYVYINLKTLIFNFIYIIIFNKQMNIKISTYIYILCKKNKKYYMIIWQVIIREKTIVSL